MQHELVGALLIAGFLAMPSAASAHGTADHAKQASAPISTDEHPFGVEGDPKKASRTIKLSMDDTMHY